MIGAAVCGILRVSGPHPASDTTGDLMKSGKSGVCQPYIDFISRFMAAGLVIIVALVPRPPIFQCLASLFGEMVACWCASGCAPRNMRDGHFNVAGLVKSHVDSGYAGG